MVAKETLSFGGTEDATGTVDVEEVVGTVDSRAVRTKDLMNAMTYSWQPQGQGESCLPVDGTSDDQSMTTIESVQGEPSPACLSSSLSKSHSQTLGRGDAQGNSMGQDQNSTKKTWLRRFVKKLTWASGS